QLLTSASLLHRWLARLRCSDGFKLFLVVLLVSAALAEVRFVASASMAPTLRPGDRAVAEKGELHACSGGRLWGILSSSGCLPRCRIVA
uniref:Peptidase S26 domain-containing protein n=1 Tax=Aegilops tauschii subsp. strangulata TaxID=200361 RepID=A0A453DMJ0_AEGTS